MSLKDRNLRAKPFLNPLCVALDVDDLNRARNLALSLSEVVGGFKLGPRLIIRHGAHLIEEFSKIAPVFVDCKFFDIPSTMASSVEACFEAGASAVTVHALSGLESLRAVAEVEKKWQNVRPVKVFAVSILTSWDESSYPELIQPAPVTQHVQSLAKLVAQSGLSSLVCSGFELESLKGKLEYFVVPGLRFSLEERGDQKRVMDPREAINKGANLLVVGRPIIEARSPLEAATDYITEIYR